MDEDKNKKIVKSNPATPKSIPLSPSNSLDLSWLPEDKREVLLKDYTKGILDIATKAQELHVDSNALKKTLDDLSDTTAQVSEGGDAITVTHTQTSKVGRTEIMMGNTEEAFKGKFTKSQTGEKNWTPYYIFAGIIALILIAALMSK